MRQAIVILVSLAALAIPATADARPGLSVKQAEAAAHRSLVDNQALWNREQALAAAEPEEGIEPEPTITSIALEGCELLGRYRAECPFEQTTSAGEEEDDVLEVVITPRGHLDVVWPTS